MFRLTFFAVVLIPIIFGFCPPGSYEYQTNCYFFQNNPTGFSTAELNCVSIGGHLASIHDGFTNSLLTQQSLSFFNASTDFWIGLDNLQTMGNNWYWTDGSTFDFFDWNNGMPENLQTQNCVTISMIDGRWNNENCFMPKSYVCAINSAATTPPPSAYPCSGGFLYYEPTNSCYGVYTHQEDQTWSNSESYCESLKGHLTSVHNYAEFRLIAAFASYGKYAPWCGLFSNDGGRSWQWSDKSSADYLPWQPGYPSGSGPCVALAHSGLINADCNQEQPMICKIQL
jgi:hypothetical protein